MSGQMHGRRLTLVLATLLAVLVVAGGATAFAVGRAQRVAGQPGGSVPSGTTTSNSATPPLTEPTHSPPASQPGDGTAPVDSTQKRPPSASPDTTKGPVPSASPVGPVAVTLSARAVASPDSQPVEDLLARYFTAINQHDYDAWLSTVSTSQAKRNRDDWTDSYSTTTDEDVYVSDIFRKGSNLLVRIQFVSHQAVDKAPKTLPARCIRWDVTYQIVDEGTGLRVGNSAESPTMAACS